MRRDNLSVSGQIAADYKEEAGGCRLRLLRRIYAAVLQASGGTLRDLLTPSPVADRSPNGLIPPASSNLNNDVRCAVVLPNARTREGRLSPLFATPGVSTYTETGRWRCGICRAGADSRAAERGAGGITEAARDASQRPKPCLFREIRGIADGSAAPPRWPRNCKLANWPHEAPEGFAYAPEVDHAF